MTLSDVDIRKKNGASLEPFNEKNLTPNGYDLTISEVYISTTGDKISDGVAKVPPKTWFAVSTSEYVKMSNRVCGQLWIRTTWARKGVISSFGMIDAGFEGTLTLSSYNASNEPLRLPVGERFAQMVFHELKKEAETGYGSRSGNYQGQRGVTLAKKE